MRRFSVSTQALWGLQTVLSKTLKILAHPLSALYSVAFLFQGRKVRRDTKELADIQDLLAIPDLRGRRVR